MKFASKLDVQTFLIEIQALDKISSVDESYKASVDEVTNFLKARNPLVKKLKDHGKSSKQKANWRKNRTGMMKGIKAFHRSVAGKRFHKKLGRFLATRIFRPKRSKSEAHLSMLQDRQEFLVGLNSAKQHLLIELEYFHQLQEQVELEDFITDYAFPYFRIIEDKIIQDEELTDDELVFLMDIVENNALINSLATKSGQTFAQIEKLWDSISNDLKADGTTEDDEKFFPVLVTILKNKLGLK